MRHSELVSESDEPPLQQNVFPKIAIKMKLSQIKSIIGVLLGFSIGFASRLTDIPLPAPPMIYGSVLVLTITVGFILADRYLSSNTSTKTNKEV